VESSCECGDEPSDSIKCWDIVEWLHNSGIVLSPIELVSQYLCNYFVYDLQEIECHMKTHSNVKSLQTAYESLCSELNKLTSVSSKQTGLIVEEETVVVKNPM
jgi:hypothetical protein